MSEDPKAEARGLGAYAVADGDELEAAMIWLRAERAGMPPCFRLSYSGSARECRICDARIKCGGEPDITAELDPVPVTCDLCGNCLATPLTDGASKEVVDYGCSDPNCTGTLATQCGYTPPPVPIKLLGSDLCGEILRYLKENPGSKIQDVVKNTAPDATVKLKRDAVQKLKRSGDIIQERAGKSVRLFVND